MHGSVFLDLPFGRLLVCRAYPSSGCRHLLPVLTGRRDLAATCPSPAGFSSGTSPLPACGERVRVRGRPELVTQ
ncbi:hypothetical protein IE4803_CH01163 [Rhizobium etli bv. phaseoli str. IE4803]|nr:hypothetical protein IE4803_CH01163 [Rhizobium etli bv. phaseoli str. IE4803]